jgi:hypothetical protein
MIDFFYRAIVPKSQDQSSREPMPAMLRRASALSDGMLRQIRLRSDIRLSYCVKVSQPMPPLFGVDPERNAEQACSLE